MGDIHRKAKPSDHELRRGFTIVELLITVVVIAILATITVVSYKSITDRASESVAKSALHQMETSIALEVAVNSEFLENLNAGGQTQRQVSSLQWLNKNLKPPANSKHRISVILISARSGGWPPSVPVTFAARIAIPSDSGKITSNIDTSDNSWVFNDLQDDDPIYPCGEVPCLYASAASTPIFSGGVTYSGGAYVFDSAEMQWKIFSAGVPS